MRFTFDGTVLLFATAAKAEEQRADAISLGDKPGSVRPATKAEVAEEDAEFRRLVAAERACGC